MVELTRFQRNLQRAFKLNCRVEPIPLYPEDERRCHRSRAVTHGFEFIILLRLNIGVDAIRSLGGADQRSVVD